MNDGDKAEYFDDLYTTEKPSPTDVKYEYFRDFKEDKRLGKGSQGAVYKVQRGGQTFAVKKMQLSKGIDRGIWREIDNARDMSGIHPGIVRVYEWWKENNILYILMEYCDRGSLNKWLVHRDSTQPVQAFRQIVEAVAAMHRHSIMHRDIKPENIMISSTSGWKLGDFGVSKFNNQKLSTMFGKHTARMGTPLYMAPELSVPRSQHRAEYGRKSDIYSLGLMLAEVLSTQEECQIDRKKIVMGARNRQYVHRHTYTELDLLNRMLHRNYHYRPLAAQVLEHPLFRRADMARGGDQSAVRDWNRSIAGESLMSSAPTPYNTQRSKTGPRGDAADEQFPKPEPPKPGWFDKPKPPISDMPKPSEVPNRGVINTWREKHKQRDRSPKRERSDKRAMLENIERDAPWRERMRLFAKRARDEHRGKPL